MQLYDYEVTETFFLNKETEQYIELEFGPHGQHLILLLNGYRNDITQMLPVTYTANIGKYSIHFFNIHIEIFDARYKSE